MDEEKEGTHHIGTHSALKTGCIAWVCCMYSTVVVGVRARSQPRQPVDMEEEGMGKHRRKYTHIERMHNKWREAFQALLWLYFTMV